MASTNPDPLAEVAALEGVAVAAAQARDSIDALLRHPAMRRRSGAVAARCAIVDARASATLQGADADDPDDPVLQGTLRVAVELPSLALTWRRAPGQALARLHLLAAKGLVDDDGLGRPRPDAEAGIRLRQLLDLAVRPTSAPALVVAAVVHGELAALAPFGSADAVVARAAERVVLVALGADSAAVCPTAAGHLALRRRYAALLPAYASGRRDGLVAWLRYVADACMAAAEEGLRVAGEVATG